ncbi:MAG: hypothetical protein ABSG03_33295 [Bryobacteraceae bacterium]|jgi:REP element-mobilizing transposase RayT
MVVEAIPFNATELGHYELYAYVVMPNRVHWLATPAVELQKLTRSLKSITSKRANALLGLTADHLGTCAWTISSFYR